MEERVLFDDVVNLLSQPWFFGNVSAKKATSLLENASGGTYLVRFSQNLGSSFTVSLKPKKKETTIQHYRVTCPPNTPIINAITALVKKVDGKKPLDRGRPAEYVALFTQPGNDCYYLEDKTKNHLPNANPWHSTKVIF